MSGSGDLMDRIWAQLEPIVFITRAQFERGLEGWEIEPVEIEGELAFATFSKGPEFHFTSFDTGHLITREMIHTRLRVIIDRHGYATTRTPRDESPRQHRLNKRLGFHVESESEFFIHYRLDGPCQLSP